MGVTFTMKSTAELLKKRNLENGGLTQQYIDKEVLRLNDRYIPKRTGALINSGTLHTRIGSGKVIYETPYARQQYYHNAGRGLQGTAGGGLRGRLWFERMKAAHRGEILENAAKISGARPPER